MNSDRARAICDKFLCQLFRLGFAAAEIQRDCVSALTC
jgi:hypothetical protein